MGLKRFKLKMPSISKKNIIKHFKIVCLHFLIKTSMPCASLYTILYMYTPGPGHAGDLKKTTTKRSFVTSPTHSLTHSLTWVPRKALPAADLAGATIYCYKDRSFLALVPGR